MTRHHPTDATSTDTTTDADNPIDEHNCPRCTKWWKCMRHRDNDGNDENQWIIRTRTHDTNTVCACTPTTPCAQHCTPRFP